MLRLLVILGNDGNSARYHEFSYAARLLDFYYPAEGYTRGKSGKCLLFFFRAHIADILGTMWNRGKSAAWNSIKGNPSAKIRFENSEIPLQFKESGTITPQRPQRFGFFPCVLRSSLSLSLSFSRYWSISFDLPSCHYLPVENPLPTQFLDLSLSLSFSDKSPRKQPTSIE